MKGLRTLAAIAVAAVVGMVGMGFGAAPDTPSGSALASQPLAATDAVASAPTTAKGFSLRPGGATDVGVGANGSVWIIGTNPLPGGFGIYHWNGSGWGQVRGEASTISVGPHGDATVANSSGHIYHWNGGGWGLMRGGATDVGVGANGSVWVIGTNATPGGFGIYRWTGSGWLRVPGAGQRIAVDPHGDPWVVNSYGHIYHWNGGGWTLLRGGATDVGVGANGSVWIIGTNPVSGGRGVYRWTGTGWLRVAGGGIRIAVDPAGNPWLVNSSHKVYSYGPIPSGGSSAPTSPPVQVCNNSSLLTGPSSAPVGAVTVPAGDNVSQLASRTLPAHTTYWFAPGKHTLGTGEYTQIQPGNNDTLIGGPGAVVDGQGANNYAITGHATGVTIEYLTIQDFSTPNNEGAVNHDSGANWTIQYNTIQDVGSSSVNGAAIVGGDNLLVKFNCLYHNGQYGVNGVGQDSGSYSVVGMTITNNEFSDNAYAGDPCGCGGGMKLWNSEDTTVTHNWVHGNGSIGIWADTDNNGTVIEGNYVASNWNSGVAEEISYNALIENNTFAGNATIASSEDGINNPGFPTGAIYINASGGDNRVPNDFGITTLTISGNQFIDNWGGVVVYENGDRYCGSGGDKFCTLVNPSVYTISSCQANISEKSPTDYFDNCQWKAQNVRVSGNVFQFTQADIPGCKLGSNSCGQNALFGTYGSGPYTGPVMPLAISDNQNNVFQDNAYVGPWSFVGFNQGDEITQQQWTQGFTDGSSHDQFSGQDSGSTFTA